jgi:hypothetical protein
MTKRQKRRERLAQTCEGIAKRGNPEMGIKPWRSEIAMELRATNRRIEMKKSRA